MKLRLFECCHITKGYKRSLVADMQRNTYYLVPNSLANLFDEKNIFQIPPGLSEEELLIVEEYSDFLLQNEVAFECDDDIVAHFPLIDIKEWNYPAHITNAIVLLRPQQFEERKNIFIQITDHLLSRHLEICITAPVDIDVLETMLDFFDSLDLYNYNIICSALTQQDVTAMVKVIKDRHKIFRTIIYGADRDEVLTSEKNNWGNIFIQQSAFSYQSCGQISQAYFTNNIDHISESQNYNTCLNRKLTIDEAGNIKNCPALSQVHGNIESDMLMDAIKKDAFRNYWYLSKSKIDICRDCEYRDVCTDCRAFLEDPDNELSKPLKCGYNPYTSEWDDWSNNPLKDAARKHYGI